MLSANTANGSSDSAGILRGASERLVDLLCFPLADIEASITKLPGHRVRRFSLQRQGRQGRLYFLDGTPTTIVLDLDHDDARVLHWIGLPGLRDGESQWFDLAARPVESALSKMTTPTHAFSVHPLPHDAIP